jgi:hypothetical protein
MLRSHVKAVRILETSNFRTNVCLNDVRVDSFSLNQLFDIFQRSVVGADIFNRLNFLLTLEVSAGAHFKFMFALADSKSLLVDRRQFDSTDGFARCIFDSPSHFVHWVDFPLLSQTEVQDFELKEVLLKAVKLFKGVARREINKISFYYVF